MGADSIRSYSISTDELQLILAGMGVKRWYGFSGRDTALSAEDVNRIIACLWEKDIALFSDGTFRVREEYIPVFDTIGNADHCVVSVNSRDGLKTMMSYISGGQAAVVEKRPGKANDLRLTLMPVRKWSGYLIRECVDFDSISGEPSYHKDPESLTLDDQKMSIQEVAMGKDILSVFDKVDTKTGAAENRIILKEDGIKRYITYEDALMKKASLIQGGAAEAGELLAKWVM